MKYVVTDAQSEAVLALVDSENGAGRWDVELAAGARKSSLRGNLEFKDGMITAQLTEPEGTRITLPAFRHEATGVLTVATPLGNISVKAARGSGAEGPATGKTGPRSVKSPIPGKIFKVLCKEGDTVQAGQSILVIEAMKMENEIRAPQAGRIESLSVQPGASVATGDLLLKIGKLENG